MHTGIEGGERYRSPSQDDDQQQCLLTTPEPQVAHSAPAMVPEDCLMSASGDSCWQPHTALSAFMEAPRSRGEARSRSWAHDFPDMASRTIRAASFSSAALGASFNVDSERWGAPDERLSRPGLSR